MSAFAQRGWLHWQVRAWLLLGRQDRALVGLHRALQTDPTDAHARATRAHVLAQRGEKTAALQDLAQLVALAPDGAVGWFNYGFLSEDMGLLAQAEAAFLRATALDPQLDRAWYGLGLCHIRQGRLAQARLALQKNTALQPLSPFGWFQLARVHDALNEPAEAHKIIRHLRTFEPKVAAQLEREIVSGAARPDQDTAVASAPLAVAQGLRSTRP